MPSSDLRQGLALFGLVVIFRAASGGHFNPAVTLAVAAIKRISPVDALIYMLAQLSGGVLGALLCKGLLVDEGRATHYGAAEVTGLLGGNFQGSIVEALGAFVLVLVVLVAVYSKDGQKDWAPFAYGTTLTFLVMVGGPLTGGSFNPARWFGPALVGNEWGGVWPYVVGPIVGARSPWRCSSSSSRPQRPGAGRPTRAGPRPRRSPVPPPERALPSDSLAAGPSGPAVGISARS